MWRSRSDRVHAERVFRSGVKARTPGVEWSLNPTDWSHDHEARTPRARGRGGARAVPVYACTTGSTNTATTQPQTNGSPAANFPSSQPILSSGKDGVVNVVNSVLPAVVNVVVDTSAGPAEGTGFIVRSDGIIVTNYHVVENASKVAVLTSADDPVQYDARVIGGDVGADLAVLDIDANDLPTVTLGDSDALQLGQRVVAVGYALGLEGGPSVTAGIVSSLTRQIDVQDTGCPVSECGADQTRVY